MEDVKGSDQSPTQVKHRTAPCAALHPAAEG